MEENNLTEMEPPAPVPATAPTDTPQMSEIAAIGNVFIEPGNVFDDMRRKPRFLIAGLIVLAAISIFQITFIEKIGLEKIVKARVEASKRTAELDKEQKDKIVEQQSGPVAKYITYGATPVVIGIVFLLGGLIYWLGANAMGGTGKFLGGVSVWVYSSLPPAIIFTLGNLIVLFLKSADDIDIANSQSGLLKANLGFFVDATTSPTLAALLGSVDLFSIWGWILATIGLQRVAKISSGASWAVVLMLALVGVAAKVVGSLFF